MYFQTYEEQGYSFRAYNLPAFFLHSFVVGV